MGLSTLKYSTSEALETWPMPRQERTSPLAALGERYYVLREDVMRNEWIGLTQVYNRFHNPEDRAPGIEKLRALHRQMDIAVASAYGWDDLDLAHGFQEVDYLPANDRIRFTIAGPPRVEVLRRLAQLNRVRYEEEVAQGLHGGAARGQPRRRHANASTITQSTLDFSGSSENEAQYLTTAESRGRYAADPGHAIVDFLKTHYGWHAKAAILANTGLTNAQWNSAITDLVTNGLVERAGERRGARYRARSNDV